MTAITLQAVTPHKANLLKDIWGVNIHAAQVSPSAYGANSPSAIAGVIAGAGIVHARDTYGGQTKGDSSQFDSMMTALAVQGIDCGYVLQPHGGASTFSARLTQVAASGYQPAFLESYNEWNGNGGGSQTGSPPGWQSDLIAAQPTLLAAKSGNLANTVMLAPPMVSAANSSIPWPTVVANGYDATQAEATNLHIYCLNAATGGSFPPEHLTGGYAPFLGANAFAGCSKARYWSTEVGNPSTNSIEVAAIVHAGCTLTSGQNTYTDPTANSTLVGLFPIAAGIAVGTKVSSVVGNTVTLSANVTVSSTATVSYGSNVNGFLPELSATKGSVRSGLWLALQGFERVYLYEALDERTPPTVNGGEHRFGVLAHTDLTPKDGASAFANITSLMADSTGFSPAPIQAGVQYNGANIAYNSGTNNVWWDLYQFSNGDLALIYWIGLTPWSSVAGLGFVGPGAPGGTNQTLTPQGITVSLPGNPFSRWTKYRPFTSASPVQGGLGGVTANFGDPDESPTIVILKTSERSTGRPRAVPFFPQTILTPGY